MERTGTKKRNRPRRRRAFYLITGRYPFDSTVRRNAFLENVGASLVFLIDWEKARKVLREWVANADAVHIIEWAARHRVGHRAFLQLGGAELVGPPSGTPRLRA